MTSFTHHKEETMRRKKLLGAFIMLSLLSLSATGQVGAATYTVISTDDSGVGSLRWAIGMANTSVGADTIEFNIGGCGGVCTICPTSALPSLTDDGTTLNGYSQPGASHATAENPAVILIKIDGSSAGLTNGLAVTSAENLIQGVSVVNFTLDGIVIGGVGAIGNEVRGNYLGIDPTGIAAGNGYSGVFVRLGAQDNVIGGDEPAHRNVLSGNAWSGVELHGSDTRGNGVVGNYIGTDPAGSASVPNALFGVYIRGGASRNFVIGFAGEFNLIAGNGGHGVAVVGEYTDENYIVYNYIGTTADGLTGLGNGATGILIENGPQQTEVRENIISANEDGVVVQSRAGTTTDTGLTGIYANIIGMGVDGVTPLANARDGVRIGFLAHSNQVANNRIAHNGDDGVHVDTPTAVNNLIYWNSIYDNDGLGIHLTNGANGGMAPPLIHAVDVRARILSGATCPGCRVEVFASPDDNGQGRAIIGWTEAGPAGDFTAELDSLPHRYLTATSSNIDGREGTSEFSDVFAVDIGSSVLSYMTAILGARRER